MILTTAILVRHKQLAYEKFYLPDQIRIVSDPRKPGVNSVPWHTLT